MYTEEFGDIMSFRNSQLYLTRKLKIIQQCQVFMPAVFGHKGKGGSSIMYAIKSWFPLTAGVLISQTVLGVL